MKLKLIPFPADYLNDVQDVPRAFSPYLEIVSEGENFLKWDCSYDNGSFSCEIKSDVLGSAVKTFSVSDSDVSLYKKLTKRFLKNFLYDFLSERLGIALPYGSLTGVRPTKLYYELMQSVEAPRDYLIENFKVEKSRARLIAECVENQKGYINSDKRSVALFVNIPFCPTRCSYCSFISTEISRVKKEIPIYTENLRRELASVKAFLLEKKLNVSSIYVGGGTPPSIGAEALDSVLGEIKDFGVEFTVEAGRPDVIDDELVEVLKKNNVTRVSVNPQSFHQKTLDVIGRRHTVEEIFTAYNRVKPHFSVNTDLIVGLPEETFEDFAESLQRTIDLQPDNITVHTLSLKRGSVMTAEGVTKEAGGHIKRAVDYSVETLVSRGYKPYYMYRQKNMYDNLENVGYTLPSRQCKYNIDMMEESINVIGVGAGAMSKFLSDGRIERLSNPKGFREYNDRIDSIISKKTEFFDF